MIGEGETSSKRVESWICGLYMMKTADITSAIAVLFEIMQHARMTFAKSPPGTTVGGW